MRHLDLQIDTQSICLNGEQSVKNYIELKRSKNPLEMSANDE